LLPVATCFDTSVFGGTDAALRHACVISRTAVTAQSNPTVKIVPLIFTITTLLLDVGTFGIPSGRGIVNTG
jgi:hypothetical protein